MLSRGCKVIMKGGEILTVKSLEFDCFVPEERAEYIPKRDILEVAEKRPYATKTKRRTYTVTDEVHAELKRLGQGNASRGIREAVNRSKQY